MRGMDRMKEKMISIIIPVYNSRERLRECLESVVAQSYENKEVIVVDDCSTDGSLEICREYEKNYSFFRVYTKENEGVSAARNYGLSKARGEYIEFVDSDDMLYPDACKLLEERIRRDGSDLVIGGYYNEKEERKILYGDALFSERKEFMKEFPGLFSGFFLHVPWNKLYRRSVIEAAGAEFPRDFSKGEDLLFNLRVLEKTEKISVMNEVLYFYYNISENSLSFRFREDAMEIEERLYRAVEAFYKKYDEGESLVFLHRFYLTAVKNKFYALTGKSGFDRKTCRKVIEQWLRMESIEELCEAAGEFGKKDRFLLFLMKRRMTGLLYDYYKKAGK